MRKILSFLKKYLFLIGILLFVIILSKSNIGEIIKNIGHIKPIYLIITTLIFIPYLIMKVFCWKYILRQQGIRYQLKDLFLMYCSGLYLGILTPGRMGEIAKALYLKQDGHSMGKSLISIVIDRVSDLAFLVTFIFLGSLFYVTMFQKQVLILVSGIFLAIILFFIFSKIGLIRWGLNKIFYILIPKKNQESWKVNFQDFMSEIKNYKLKHYFVILFITAIYWLLYYLMAYILAIGVGINIPILYFAISITVAGLITLIPISVSGIGTRDFVLLALFAPFAINIEKIITLSTLILSIALFTALVGLFCWMIKPIKL
jgi:glycosyltransferase 2 family protein